MLFTPARRPPRVAVDYSNAPSMTKQSFADECDINRILKRFVQQGALSPGDVQRREAMYLDVSDVGDLQRCYQAVQAAEDGFAALPAAVRDRFNNDPGVLLAWVMDPANASEAVELGLLEGEAPVKGGKPVSEPPGSSEGAPHGGGD